HVWHIATALNDVVHSDRRFDKFAHAIQTGCEELECRNRASTVPGIGGGVSGLAFELDDEVDDCLRAVDVSYDLILGMPGQTDVNILEETVTSHVDLAANGFFGRRTVKPNGALELAGGDQLFDCHGSTQAGRAKQVVAAPVPRRSGFQSLFHGLGLLGDPGKRIILAEDSDDRATLPVAGYERRRHAGNSTIDLETLFLSVVG